MRALVLVAALVSSIWAQPQDTEKMYQQMRQEGIEMTGKMIPALKEMKRCLSKAGTMETAQACTSIMEKALGEKVEPIVEDEKAWDESVKKKVIFDIDVAIHESTEAGKCFTANDKFEQFRECVNKAQIN